MGTYIDIHGVVHKYDQTRYKAYKAKWAKENRKKCIESVKAWLRRQRLRVLEVYGNKCAKCSATKGLQIHHKNFDGDEDRKKYGAEAFRWALPKRDDLELLCHSCHYNTHLEHDGSYGFIKV